MVKSDGRDRTEVVPADRERHRDAGTDAGAVRRDHGGAADAGGVDEHLAAAVVLHERGGGELGVEAARPRAAIARVAAAASSTDASVVDRHEHVEALGATGLHRADEADLGQRLANQARHGDHVVRTHRPPVDRGRARGASGDRAGRTVTKVGWYSIARWFANHSKVRRSSHNAYDTSRFDVSAHSVTVRTHSGVYFGTFFCMNASCPRWTRITDSGRSSSTGRMRSRDRVEVVDQVAAWSRRRRRRTADRGWSATRPRGTRRPGRSPDQR